MPFQRLLPAYGKPDVALQGVEGRAGVAVPAAEVHERPILALNQDRGIPAGLAVAAAAILVAAVIARRVLKRAGLDTIMID